MSACVLFVDDNENLLRSMYRQLRSDPFTIRATASPNVALALLQNRAVQVLVVDEQMPGMCGSELLERVSQLYPHVINIMLTGNPSVPLLQELVNKQRLFRFLTKPCQVEDLRAAINEAINLSRTFSVCEEVLGVNNNELSEREKLEQCYPGITHVERNADGAVLLDANVAGCPQSPSLASRTLSPKGEKQ
ncbi:MAG: response regulator [Oligoflexia bacterium]|nr:response regulator [Oligoflexia bacterium]